VPTSVRLDDPARLSPPLLRFATDVPRSNRPLVLAGVDDKTRQIFVGSLAAEADLQLHQVDLSDLHAGDMAATQGNLREVFDSSGEVPSVLCLHHAGAFFQQVAHTDRAEGRDDDELTEDVYLFDRIAAFGGLVVLAFESTSVPTSVAQQAAHVVTG
jgi:hypothetical protein